MLAGGDMGGGVTVWEVASGRVRASFRGHRGGVCSVTFVAGGTLLASGGYDGVVRLWDLRKRKLRAALEGHSDKVFDLARAGELLASAGWDKTVRLWDTAAGKQLLVLKLGYQAWSVAFSPEGELLAAAD